MERPDFTSDAVRDLRRRVALSCRILYKLGLADYLGHPSARIGDSEYVVVKPKHSVRIRGMAEMTAENMCIVDLDGKQYAGEDAPPSELSLHLEIYRARPDVKAVVHTHQLTATCFGVAGREILPLLHLESQFIGDEIAVYPSAQLIVNAERGRAVARALGSHSVMHLQGHGIVTTAADVEGATLSAIHLERLAQANYMVAVLGGPQRVIPPDELAQLRADTQAPAGRWAYYASLVDQSE
jgi:L-ribulose-5-phosphate 4-epimerase